jgi:hypothetical protein
VSRCARTLNPIEDRSRFRMSAAAPQYHLSSGKDAWRAAPISMDRSDRLLRTSACSCERNSALYVTHARSHTERVPFWPGSKGARSTNVIEGVPALGTASLRGAHPTRIAHAHAYKSGVHASAIEYHVGEVGRGGDSAFRPFLANSTAVSF